MAAHPLHLQLSPLATAQASALEEVRVALNGELSGGLAVLHGADRPLTLPELQAIQALLRSAHLELHQVESAETSSLVAAAALGLGTVFSPAARVPTAEEPDPDAAAELTIHRGTLRSGDHLQVQGSVLLLGDVNPGARISAGGDVRVWGRLRGVAHAGCAGNTEARIVALQLRPLQLRIAAAVARGPEDQPPAGFCEEAVLVEGAIAIRPAEPHWPQT
jgi:septum site-determining protein MinC